MTLLSFPPIKPNSNSNTSTSNTDSDSDNEGTPLTAYLPSLLLSQVPVSPAPFALPPGSPVLMLADASGFTKLTNLLSADEMSVVLNRFFSKMMDIIAKYGGDVLKFAGDALIIYFPPGDGVSKRGLACALEMSEELHDYPATQGHTLSLHVAVLKVPGSDQRDGLKGSVLGSVGSRFEFVVSSPHIGDSGVILVNTRGGEVGCNMGVLEDVETAKGVKIGETERGEYFTVVNNDECLAALRIVITKAEEPSPSPKHSDLSPFVPYPVLEYYSHSLSSYLSSLRVISTVFISLPSPSTFATSNAQFTSCLSLLSAAGGLLRQYCVDDKSNVFIAAFGCPLMSRQDDGKRCLDFCLSVRRKVSGANIGVSRGSCYCGVLGSRDRCEYVVLGGKVNLAARLMGVAMKTAGEGTVVVDDDTFKLLKEDPSYDWISGPVEKELKGFGSTLTHSVAQSENFDCSTDTDDKSVEVLRGQEETVEAIRRNLARDKGGTNRVALTAPTGMGKSLILANLLPKDALVNRCRAEPNARTTPWSTCRKLMRLLKSYTQDVEEQELLPLLNDVFPKVRAQLKTRMPAVIQHQQSFSMSETAISDISTISGEGEGKRGAKRSEAKRSEATS